MEIPRRTKRIFAWSGLTACLAIGAAFEISECVHREGQIQTIEQRLPHATGERSARLQHRYDQYRDYLTVDAVVSAALMGGTVLAGFGALLVLESDDGSIPELPGHYRPQHSARQPLSRDEH